MTSDEQAKLDEQIALIRKMFYTAFQLVGVVYSKAPDKARELVAEYEQQLEAVREHMRGN